MAFTVALPGGMKDFEFAAYVRLLEKEGVNIGFAARVPDPQTKKRCLFAWEDNRAAARFAAALSAETENQNWQVYDLSGIVPGQGPLGPIEILIARRSDGCTYSLSPTSRKLVHQRFPYTQMVASAFVAT